MGCYPFSYTLATGVFIRIIKNKTLTGFPGLPADPRLPRTPGGPCHSIKGRDATSFRSKNDHFLSARLSSRMFFRTSVCATIRAAGTNKSSG